MVLKGHPHVCAYVSSAANQLKFQPPSFGIYSKMMRSESYSSLRRRKAQAKCQSHRCSSQFSQKFLSFQGFPAYMAYQATALRANANGSSPPQPGAAATAPTTAAAAASVAAALREVLARNTQLYWREFRVAPLWKRFVAEAIDFIIL